MVVYGIQTLTGRSQAQELLARAIQLHWGLERLPAQMRTRWGKPYFPDLPQYRFNLSHSGSFALCALSAHPVGVDIQVVRPAWSPKLVERSCTPEERAWLSSRRDAPEDFAALWACKESMGKQSGQGLPYPPSRLAAPLPENGLPLPTQTTTGDGRFLCLYSGEGWRGAVCSLEPPPEAVTWLSLPS